MSGFLILTPSLVTLFLLWDCLVQPSCHGFLFYLIILYLVTFFFFSLRSSFFLMRNRKGINSEGRRDGKELEGVERGKTVIRIKCVTKESIFNKREK